MIMVLTTNTGSHSIQVSEDTKWLKLAVSTKESSLKLKPDSNKQ